MWNVINDHKDFSKQKWWMEQTELLQLDQSDIIYFKMNENLGIEKSILAQIKSFSTNYFSSKQYLLVD